MTPDEILLEIHGKVAAIDERTENFCTRLTKVEQTCTHLDLTMAREQGRDEARDRDLAELRTAARSNGSWYGAAAGGAVGIMASAAKAAWEWFSGAPAPQ